MINVNFKKIKYYALPIHSRGFTLIETLLIVAIAVGIFALSAPYTMNFYKSNLIEDSRSNIADTLQRAKHNAALQKNDSSFGVHFDQTANTYTLFQGDDYSTRDDTQDEVYTIIDQIILSGLEDVIFSKLSSIPRATGTITLIYGNFIKEIIIDDSGLVSKVD